MRYELATYSPSSVQRVSSCNVRQVSDRLTNENGPDIDEHEECNVSKFLKWKDKREQMIRYTLGEPVHRVEGMTRVRRGHDPFVMRLVQGLVYLRMVQSSVDPVDAQISEADEQRKLKVVVESKGGIRRRIVEFTIPADFGEEAGGGENCHEGHGYHGLADLELDLVLEVFWVGEGSVVEDKEVGQGGADEVEDQAEEPVPRRQKRWRDSGGGKHWPYHVMR